MKNLKGIIRELVQEVLEETSVSGGGAAGASFTPGAGEQYMTTRAFNPNKKAKGTSRNKKHKSGIIVKHLWGK